MVTNGPEEVRRLPDEAFASRGGRPNPAVDQHVAFPEAAPVARGTLPDSAWRPATSAGPAPPITVSTRRRLGAGPAALAVAAMFGLALLTNAGDSSSGTTQGGFEAVEGGDGVWPHGDASTQIELLAVPGHDVPGIQPVEQPRYEIPLGPSLIRIEVVSDDPTADVVVTSDFGFAQAEDETLPYAVEFGLDERPDQLAVTARNRYGTNSIQCRVYADGSLVSIATGVGLVECAPQPAR